MLVRGFPPFSHKTRKGRGTEGLWASDMNPDLSRRSGQRVHDAKFWVRRFASGLLRQIPPAQAELGRGTPHPRPTLPKLLNAGFRFEYPEIEGALRAVIQG
jgi:hypothetical protein